METAKVIKNSSDGNCLFNCVAIFLDRTLYYCKRDENGIPTSKKNRQREINFASNLRKMVCFRMLEMEKELKNDIEFDDFSTLEERVVEMKKNKVWGGMPEIKTLSEMLKLSFNIFVPLEEKFVNHIGKIGEYKRTCNLLLDCSHYEIIEFVNKDILVIDEKYLNECKSEIKSENIKEVVKASFKKETNIDGYLIRNIDKEHIETLKLLSENKTGEYIEKLNSWFFYDNFKGYKAFCNENNIQFS